MDGDGVNSEKNHAKYFTLSLLAVLAAAMQYACAAAIELSSQDFFAAEVTKSLLISPVFDDGRPQGVISFCVRDTKGAPLDVRRLEFVKIGKQWKISDVVEGGWRFSQDCAEERAKAPN